MTHNYNRFYLLMIEKHTHYALTLAGVLLMHVVPAICGDGVTHPACLSECLETKDIKVTLVQKRQNYCSDHKTRDTDIRSPKSVTIHPDGSKFYVNSLEGMRTVVFEVPTGKKIKTVHHRFDGSDKELWADESGYYTFKDKRRNPRTFSGKPVESAFSHKGKYLWITYYRRSYDINAQEPSAVAVLDTERDTIIRMFETGQCGSVHNRGQHYFRFDLLNESAGGAVLCLTDLIRATGRDNTATFGTTSRSHVDDVVGVADDIQIVLDDYDGGSVIDKALEHFQ